MTQDIKWLEDNLENFRGSFETKELFKHFKFVQGGKVRELVNDPVVELLPPAFS